MPKQQTVTVFKAENEKGQWLGTISITDREHIDVTTMMRAFNWDELVELGKTFRAANEFLMDQQQ